jgi:hypothetical protein
MAIWKDCSSIATPEVPDTFQKEKTPGRIHLPHFTAKTETKA